MTGGKEIGYGVLAGVGAFAASFAVYKGVQYLCNKCKRPSNPYEANKMVNEYMAFHYTPPEEYLTYPSGPKEALEFSKRCAELCLKHKQEGVVSRAMDIGCSVGRSTFELAQHFDEVVGIDYSRSFIQRCQELKKTGQAAYWLTTEGMLGEEKTAHVHPDVDRTRASFMVGDACHLPELGQFGCVYAGLLICRLPEPMKFFQRLPGMIVPGGTLVITSPYTWLLQYTPQSKWIGGYSDKDGVEVRGFDTLQRVLGPHFDLVEAVDMPYLIRETLREHQWTVAHATVWRRKTE